MNREEKMKIVINNYFKKECSVNTSIREAFEKGFRIGASKVQKKHGKWLIRKFGDDAQCSNCGQYFKDVYDMDNYDQYCRHCGTQMKGIEQHE